MFTCPRQVRTTLIAVSSREMTDEQISTQCATVQMDCTDKRAFVHYLNRLGTNSIANSVVWVVRSDLWCARFHRTSTATSLRHFVTPLSLPQHIPRFAKYFCDDICARRDEYEEGLLSAKVCSALFVFVAGFYPVSSCNILLDLVARATLN